jgi:tripartite-type tricarboxylate transporter receptor subunit TctC
MITTLTRRLALGLACIALSGVALAQPFPSKPIRVLNGWTPGGPGDALTRPIMARMSERLGQPVIVENRAGASGMIAAQAVAKAPPDGYTLLTGNLGPVAISPVQEANAPYDSARDFDAITQLVSSPLVLLVRPGLPVQDVRELVAYAKANPGKLNYGHLGPMSSPHLAAEMLMSDAGITMQAVPYKGAAPLVTDLGGGQIDVGFINIGGAMPHIESGRVRALAVTTVRRSGALPNVPALTEIFPGYEVNSWYGMLAPAGTPKDVIDRLHREFVAVLQHPEIVQLLKTNGFEAEGTRPDQFRDKVREDLARWGAVVRRLNVSAK